MKPILFNTEMTKALLDGRKTQTRRVMKPQPESVEGGSWFYDGEIYGSDESMQSHLFHDVYGVKGSPYSSLYPDGGDKLWVRETFCPVDDTEFGGEKWIDYRATPKYSATHPAGWENLPDDEDALKWKPSIHMPKKYSRITLEIKDVRVERIQDISEWDTLTEGLLATSFVSFAGLWDSINLKRGYRWDPNPWVWVVEFEKI